MSQGRAVMKLMLFNETAVTQESWEYIWVVWASHDSLWWEGRGVRRSLFWDEAVLTLVSLQHLLRGKPRLLSKATWPETGGSFVAWHSYSNGYCVKCVPLPKLCSVITFMDEQNETFCAIYLSFLTKKISQICAKVANKIQLVQVLSSIWRSENCIMHTKHNIEKILIVLF